MGFLIEFAEFLAGTGVALSLASGVAEYLTKNQHKGAVPTVPSAGNAHVRIEMPNGDLLKFQMKPDDAKRLAER